MLDVTVVTLGDQLQIGFLGVPGAIDRIDELARHADSAYEALQMKLASRQRQTGQLRLKRRPRSPGLHCRRHD